MFIKFKKGNPELSQTRVAIQVIKQINSIINYHSYHYVIYMLTVPNKRLHISKSHGDSNRCTPYRKNLINKTCIFPTLVHVCHMYAFCGWSLYVVTSHVGPTELDGCTAPDSTSQPGWVVHVTCLSFSPKHNHWSSVLKPNIFWKIVYIGLLGPYHQHVISIFNTCSRGLTHRSLTDTGGGYNLWGAGLPHHTPRPYQPTVLHFPPKGPAWSQVIQS
jgi:hypothetical protein